MSKMSKLISNICLLISFIVVFTLTYLPVIQTNFLLLDDYGWTTLSNPKGTPQLHLKINKWFMQYSVIEGRLVGHPLRWIIFGWINYYQSLDVTRAMRFAGIIGIALLAYVLFIIFKTNHIEAQYGYLGSVLICTLPAFQLYASWIITIPNIYGALLVALAALLLFKVFLNENSGKALRIITTLFVLLSLVITLNIYQSTAMFYWAIGIIPLALISDDTLIKKRRALFMVYFSVGVISLPIYFLILKIAARVFAVSIGSRGNLITLTEIPETIKWFIHIPLIRSLNLWSICQLHEFTVIVGIIIILGFLPEFKRSILPAIRERRLNFLWNYLQRILLIIIIIPLSYFPSLVVKWRWAPFRTLVALETTLCILFFISLLNINKFLESKTALSHNHKKMIIPVLLFILTISVIYIAHHNVDKYFAKPQSLGIKYAESAIQEYGISRLSNTSSIYVTECGCVIGCGKKHKLQPRICGDEFDIPSSASELGPKVKLALSNLSIREKIDVIPVPVSVPLPEGAPVIHCTKAQNFVLEKIGVRNPELSDFYGPENEPPEHYIWRLIKPEGIISITRKDTTIELIFLCIHSAIEENPVTVNLLLNNKPFDRIIFQDERIVSKKYYIPSSIRGVPQLLLKVSRTLDSSKYGSKDNRDMGVAVMEVGNPAVTDLNHQAY